MAKFRIDDCTASRAPGRLIRRIDKLMRGLMEERLASLETSYAQWVALKLVRDGTVATAGDLGRELGFTSGATTRLIDALEERDLIARARDAGDRRVVRLTITSSGEDLADRGIVPALALWNEAVADFDQDEANRFVEMLLKLLRAIEEKAGGREPVAAEMIG